jgi:serine/threonine-protein kinase
MSARTPVPPSKPHETSIAVLPFRSVGGTTEGEDFADGMTEEIINSISNIASLQVAARTSSFAFKGRDEDVRAIGRQLGVAMVMEGSIRRAGARLRVSAQLIAVDTGYQVWSERWDRDLADVFAVQDEIAQAIAATFKLRVAEEDPVAATGTQNVEAYEHFLRGRRLLTTRRAFDAIDEFGQALEFDPDFADAHTSTADAWAILGYYGGAASWEAWARASAAVDEAERTAPGSAGVPLSRALLQHYYGWDTARLHEYCRQAIERSPRSAEGWNWLGLSLGLLGRTAEAIEAAGRGIELEPYHVNIRTSLAWVHLTIGEYEAGDRILSRALEFDPQAAYPLWSHAVASRLLGRHDESIAIFERLVEGSQRKLPFYLGHLGASLAAAGERARAEEIAHEMLERRRTRAGFVPSIDLATVLMELHDDDAALSALEAAREERNALAWWRIYFPGSEHLRAHPRWQALARKFARSAPVNLG